MKPSQHYLQGMLDLDSPEAAEDVVWTAGRPTAARTDENGAVTIDVPFRAVAAGPNRKLNDDEPTRAHRLVVRAYGDSVVRVSMALDGEPPGDKGHMLQLHESLIPEPLAVKPTGSGWDVLDSDAHLRVRIDTSEPPKRHWSDLLADAQPGFAVTVFPDGEAPVEFMAYDFFNQWQLDSLALAYVERAERAHRAAFSLHARPNERFAGTGERFARLDLSGQTLLLENGDALGVNSRRCYKNVPFYVSSAGYGLFMHTSAHVRLSLADFSTRAAQAVIDQPALDLFFIGGGNVERIVYNYRRLTGFPSDVPLWSYGTWMSRMTYFSADETRQVADRLREGRFPCDVIHLDTGWFEEDWKCTWRFGKTFPQPEKYLAEMREKGFRISLWQMPRIGSDNRLYGELRKKGYLGRRAGEADATGSDFTSGQAGVGYLDFTNPDAARWYQRQIERLLRQGAAVIKTDFGEDIDPEAKYHGMSAGELHNLYALLYQKAAWEITAQTTGEPIIWARATWAGCQRYPVHWGGDAASSWDGLAGSIRGGLHLGLSGFAFWSHDVPGFHGVPHFLNTWASDTLYVRWTQVGVLTSHLRYHGASPREPYERPKIADLVRKWLNLRYALIPYLVDQAKVAVGSGLPVFRALVFHHWDDPTCWHIDDQYYFGDAFLVAPVMNDDGVRDVYLPAGKWVDIWTGRTLEGPRWLKDIRSPLEHIPVFAAKDATMRVYPEVVQCTDEMDLANAVELRFDESYRGLSDSILGEITEL